MKLNLQQKVEHGILAPSSTLKASEVVTIINYILRWNMTDLNSICEKIIKDYGGSQEATLEIQEATLEIKISQEMLEFFTTLFGMQNMHTLDLTTKEASGYSKLGDYLLCVRNTVAEVHPNSSFSIEHQYCIQVQNSSYYPDGALVATILDTSTSTRTPIYVIEYKPRVPAELVDIEPNHLSEVMLQAVYLRRVIKSPILHVLTDLNDFHFFLISGESLQIDKYFYLKCKLSNREELLKHLKFLCHIMPL